MTWDELTDLAIEYFENNINEFNYAIEELDGWNGYLDGHYIREMDAVGDYFYDSPVRDIIQAALDGTSENGADFDPDEDYFYWDWNQLVSTNDYDYSNYLDKDFIESLYRQYYRQITKHYGSVLDLPEYIKNLFDEYMATEIEDNEG